MLPNLFFSCEYILKVEIKIRKAHCLKFPTTSLQHFSKMSGLWPHIIKWTLFPGQDENTILGMSTSFFTALKESRHTQVVSTVSTTFPYCPPALEDKQCYRVDLESEMPTQPKWGVAWTLFCLRDAWTHLSWGFWFSNIEPPAKLWD